MGDVRQLDTTHGEPMNDLEEEPGEEEEDIDANADAVEVVEVEEEKEPNINVIGLEPKKRTLRIFDRTI